MDFYIPSIIAVGIAAVLTGYVFVYTVESFKATL